MTRPAITLAMSVDLTDDSNGPGRALDMIRRVRLFAEELRTAGLIVEVSGNLTVQVRAPRLAPGTPPEPEND